MLTTIAHQMCVQRNKAINSLILLQSFGVTDEEILNIHELMNRARLENVVRMSRASLFNFDHMNEPNFGAPK